MVMVIEMCSALYVLEVLIFKDGCRDMLCHRVNVSFPLQKSYHSFLQGTLLKEYRLDYLLMLQLVAICLDDENISHCLVSRCGQTFCLLLYQEALSSYQ